MRCISFCTANAYKMTAIAEYFKRHHHLTTNYHDVLHITKKEKSFDVFIFPNGCCVCWGLNQRREMQLLEELRPHSIEPLEHIETDRFVFLLGEKTRIIPHLRLKAEVIWIAKEEKDNVPLKLAFSYGLAQSVKLQSYEQSVQQTINNNQHIPSELARKGYIPMSRKTISRHIGEIFMERSSVNLSSEYFDAPEYFWEYPDLETFYLMTEKFLDLHTRVDALNHKLDVLHDLFDVLNNQLQHRYSSFLEWIIILLIFSEIVIGLLRHAS